MIKIQRESVFRRVERRMEWEGTRSPREKDAYGRVAVSRADSSLLQSLFDEAAMQVIDICRPFLRSVVNSDECLELRLCLPSSASEDIEITLQAAIGNMLGSSVLAQWMEIVCPDRVAPVYARLEDYSSKVQAILYHHPAPVRRNS